MILLLLTVEHVTKNVYLCEPVSSSVQCLSPIPSSQSFVRVREIMYLKPIAHSLAHSGTQYIITVIAIGQISFKENTFPQNIQVKQNWFCEFKYSNNGRYHCLLSFHCRETAVITKCGYKPTVATPLGHSVSEQAVGLGR